MYKFTDGFLYYEEGASLIMQGCPKIKEYEILGKFSGIGFYETSRLIQACTFNNVQFAKGKDIDGNGIAELEVIISDGKKLTLYGGETIVKTKEGLEVVK